VEEHSVIELPPPPKFRYQISVEDTILAVIHKPSNSLEARVMILLPLIYITEIMFRDNEYL
jgi:hypothetical protein